MRARSGQALIETMIVIPILTGLLLGFVATAQAVSAYVEASNAVSLAATAAVTQPASDPADSAAAAQKTWQGTIHMSNALEPGPLTGCDSGYSVGSSVTCTGTARIMFSRTGVGAIIPIDPTITVTATAYGSPWRSI